MKEYKVEQDEVDIKGLEANLIDNASYRGAHKRMVLACHDVFIQYGVGILLVKRLNYPAKGMLWPLGGRIKRGIAIEDSLRDKIWGEVSLELDNITELGYARTFFQTDPFGHGKGTDTISLVYFSRGKGFLRLDGLHEEPTIILPGDYKSNRAGLHPYVRDFMDLAVTLIK